MIVCNKKKIKKVIAGILIIFSGIVLTANIYHVNKRFPKEQVEVYTPEKGMTMNGLEITPIEYKVYAPDDFFNKYPENDHFNYLKDRKDYTQKNNMVVYKVKISNYTDEDKICKPYLFSAMAKNSRWHNGLTQVDNQIKTIFEAGSTTVIELVALITTSQIQYKYIKDVYNDKYCLIASYYPVRRVFDFDIAE